jgi:hypothetical protein
MAHEWEAYALDHTDERWGVGRNMVVDGRYKFERHNRTYKSAKSAERMADCLNLEFERKQNGTNSRTTH